MEATRYCVVNVDDFGISRGVNRGVIDAYTAGVVTSASLMVDGACVEEAVDLAGLNHGLSVGLHAVFTDESGVPRIDPTDTGACRAELDRQIDHFRSLTGHKPTHLDSHHHVHRRPHWRPAFIDAAKRLGVALRDEPPIRFFGDFYGSWDDESHPEQISFDSLSMMLRGFTLGVTELATHAGYVDPEFQSSYHQERQAELATLLDPRLPELFTSLSIVLIGFRDLDRLGLR